MLGERLKKLRKERGLTQGQLGKGILSISYISQIENNTKPIPDYLLQELAKRLDVTVEQLFGSEDQKRIGLVQKRIVDALDALYHLRSMDVESSILALRKEVKGILDNEEIQIEYAILEIMYDLQQEQFDAVEEKLNVAKKLPISKYPHLFYRLLRVMGVMKYNKGLYVESLEFYRQAYNMEIENNKFTSDSAYLVYNMALSYLQLNHFQRTFYYAQIAHSRFTESGNWYGLCESLMLLGIVYYYQSNFDKALEQYNRALKLAKEFSEKYLQSKIIHNIGIVYEKLKDYKSAHFHWEEALRIKIELNNNKVIAITLYSIAEAYYQTEEYYQFNLHMDRLKESLEGCDYPLVEGKSFQLMGDYHRLLGNLSSFKSYYKLAIDRLRRGNLLLEAADLSYEMAKEFNDLLDYKEAADLYYQHHTILKKI